MKIFRNGWLVFAAVTAVECGAVIPEPKEFRLLDGSVSTNVAVVCRKDASIPHEGYNLKIAEDGVLVVSSGDAGFFYARQTLRQLEDNGTWPCCEIVDAPRYRWRGVHLDVSRHFFGVDVIKRFLDKAAEYKFNVFHWHLMDDQGCRLPLPEYPRMATIGATRPSPDYSRWIHDLCDPGQYGPFVYSREDIREVVEYAASLHITVLPEIEFPAHSREVLMAYPEFFCSDTLHLREAITMCNADGAPLKFGAEPALNKSALCVGNGATLAFARHLIDVVCELFPGEYIHIGGDECVKRNWKQCRRCQARMRAEGLKDENELQGWAVRQLVAHVVAKGRKAIGWSEIMEGGLAEDAAVMSWLEPKSGIQAAVAGHDVVMATHTYCYFDYTQDIPNDPHDVLPPGVKGNVLPIEKVYSFDPCADVPESAQRHILGGQTFLWSEQVPNESWIQWKMWPRALAMSEVLWSGPRKRSFAAFKADADSVVRKLRNAGFNAAAADAHDVDATFAPASHDAAIASAASAFAGNDLAEMREKIEQAHVVKAVDTFHGFDRIVFDFDGHDAWVVCPKGESRPGKPWTWTMQWAEAFVPRTNVPQMLNDGFHHVTIDTFSHRMDEEGLKVSAAFQKFLVDELGFAPKAYLIGMSWGGFFSVRYTVNYPSNVAKIYLDAPLLSFVDFQLIKDIGPWSGKMPAEGWGASPEMPLNMADKLAATKIPVLLLYGGVDAVVPPARNCEPFAERFKAAGGDITVVKQL